MRHQFPVMLTVIGSADQNADWYRSGSITGSSHCVYVSYVFNDSGAGRCREGQPRLAIVRLDPLSRDSSTDAITRK